MGNQCQREGDLRLQIVDFVQITGDKSQGRIARSALAAFAETVLTTQTLASANRPLR